MAEQLAAKLNNKLNYQPKEEDDVGLLPPGPENTFKKYEEELEINDFPQQARWKVTSKVRFYLHKLNNFFFKSFNILITDSYFNLVLTFSVFRKHWHKYRNILKLV